MRYEALHWRHDFPDQPVVTYSEIDDEGYEVRKVARFRDGHEEYADETTATGSTDLAEFPIPAAAETARDPDFAPVAITAAEFEDVWRRAHTR